MPDWLRQLPRLTVLQSAELLAKDVEFPHQFFLWHLRAARGLPQGFTKSGSLRSGAPVSRKIVWSAHPVRILRVDLYPLN